MSRPLIFTIFLILIIPTQGFSAGSSSSDSGNNSSYSVTSKNIELKAAETAINRKEYKKAIVELNKILAREKRLDLYNDCLKFLKTRVELDLALFKDDIWSH